MTFTDACYSAFPMSTPSSFQFQKKNPKAVISTPLGDIELRFFTDDAPRHVESFLNLIRLKFFDGLSFHRVISTLDDKPGDHTMKRQAIKEF